MKQLTGQSLLGWLHGSVALALLLPVMGCGLAEYQTQASRTQERLQQYDADDALLGEPIHLASSVVPVYLRLPREISPHPSGQNAAQGLTHFPCRLPNDKLPVLEAYVGFISVRQSPVPEILVSSIVQDLQLYSDIVLEPVHKKDETVGFRRSWESPQLLDANVSVPYRLWAWRANKEVPRNARGEALPLPPGYTAVYRYDIYLHYVERSEHVSQEGHVVVVFHQLDEPATRKRWLQLLEKPTRDGQDTPQAANGKQNPASSSSPEQSTTPANEPASLSSSAAAPDNNRNPAHPEVFRWLPNLNENHLEKAKQAALASLRVGEAARQRLQCYGR